MCLLPMLATAKPIYSTCLAGNPFTLRIPVRISNDMTVKYRWYRNDTAVTAVITLPPNEKIIAYTVPDTATYGSAEVFYFTYCIDDECGDTTWTKSPVYVVHFSTCVPPTASAISGSAWVCEGSSAAYSVTSVAETSYEWAVPEGWTVTEGQGTNSVTIKAGASAVNGSISVTPSNECGGSGAAKTLAVEVRTIPAQPSDISGSASVCHNASVTYSVTNVAGVSYTWIVPSGWGITAGQGTSSITAKVNTSGGAGFVSVKPSNECGFGAMHELEVYDNPASDMVQPSAISGSTAVCTGVSYTYSVTNVPGAAFNWVLPSGWTKTAGGTANSITVKVGTTTGSATISVGIFNPCGEAGPSRTLAVSTSAKPAQPSAITGGAVVCQNQAGVAYSVTNVANVTYTWTRPSGWTQTAGGTTNAITVTAGTAAGSIIVTPSNYCGNGETSIKSVKTTACPPTTCGGLLSAGAISSPLCINPGTIKVYGVQ